MIRGIFPRLVSFKKIPIIVGNTTIKKRETVIPDISRVRDVPRSRVTVAGTTRGAHRVSSRIIVRDRAGSPPYMETQINPDTAVGMEKSKTYPETISGLPLNTSLDKRNTSPGINPWVKRKKSSTGTGSVTALPRSRTRNFMAPDKVITPKSQGTRGRNRINTRGNRIPAKTPQGIKTGINRLSSSLTAAADSAKFWLRDMGLLYGKIKKIISPADLFQSPVSLIIISKRVIFMIIGVI
jgi:hypothetical protein